MPDDQNCSDALAVFQAYVDLIKSERETNWARNNAMLVANSLILGAIIASPSGLSGPRGLTLALRSRVPHHLGLGGDHHRRVERAHPARQASGDPGFAPLRPASQSVFRKAQATIKREARSSS
jgi:hypothetical protein